MGREAGQLGTGSAVEHVHRAVAARLHDVEDTVAVTPPEGGAVLDDQLVNWTPRPVRSGSIEPGWIRCVIARMA